MKIKQEKLKAHYDKNKGHDVLKIVDTISLNFKNIDELSNHIYSTLFDIDKKEGYVRKNLGLISKFGKLSFLSVILYPRFHYWHYQDLSIMSMG